MKRRAPIALTPALSRKRERGNSFHLSRLRERSTRVARRVRGSDSQRIVKQEEWSAALRLPLTPTLSRKRERGNRNKRERGNRSRRERGTATSGSSRCG